MKRIKDRIKRIRKQPVEAPRPERITSETVAEHRERILAGGRRFKYPVQYARVRLIRNTIIIVAITLLSLSALTWWQLYSAQTTNRIFYRITDILPLPVAKIDNENVPYSYYLLELRSSIHFLSGKNTNFDSDDGRRQLVYQKRLALDKALSATYAAKLARENNISVSEKEIDDFITRTLNENRLSTNQEVYSRAIMDYYGWDYNEFKTSLRYKLLLRKVSQVIDQPAKEKADLLLEQLRGGADFTKVAKQKSDDVGASQSGGDQGLIPKNSQDPSGLVKAATNLKVNQISDVITGTEGYHIIKLTEVNDSQVRYSQIFVSFKEFNKRLSEVKDKGGIEEYINVPKDISPVKQT